MIHGTTQRMSQRSPNWMKGWNRIFQIARTKPTQRSPPDVMNRCRKKEGCSFQRLSKATKRRYSRGSARGQKNQANRPHADRATTPATKRPVFRIPGSLPRWPKTKTRIQKTTMTHRKSGRLRYTKSVASPANAPNSHGRHERDVARASREILR